MTSYSLLQKFDISEDRTTFISWVEEGGRKCMLNVAKFVPHSNASYPRLYTYLIVTCSAKDEFRIVIEKL